MPKLMPIARVSPKNGEAERMIARHGREWIVTEEVMGRPRSLRSYHRTFKGFDGRWDYRWIPPREMADLFDVEILPDGVDE